MDVKITIAEDAQRKRPKKSEVERLWADNSKAKKMMKWSPQYSLEDGLKKTIAWFKKNPEVYKANIYSV
jgi:nucleoside-diphosphate-sugar epimerase